MNENQWKSMKINIRSLRSDEFLPLVLCLMRNINELSDLAWWIGSTATCFRSLQRRLWITFNTWYYLWLFQQTTQSSFLHVAPLACIGKNPFSLGKNPTHCLLLGDKAGLRQGRFETMKVGDMTFQILNSLLDLANHPELLLASGSSGLLGATHLN